MGGYEWEVEFESGRRFRLPAREFELAPNLLVRDERNELRPFGIAQPVGTSNLGILFLEPHDALLAH